MIALKIADNKDFMSKLLKGTAFDRFQLVEASITTYNTFTIDGSLHPDFFDSDLAKSLEQSGRTHSFWAEVKPFCFSIIKGKHTPLHLKIVFQLAPFSLGKALENCNTGLTADQVAGLFLNIRYDGREILCTTGTSLRIFTTDKTLDILWDNKIQEFFRQHGIPFELL